jgi:hypothetical protein
MGLVAVAGHLVHVVLELASTLRRCQRASVSPRPDSQIQGVNPDGQLTAITDPDGYRPGARLFALLLGRAGPSADLADLCSQPVLAQAPQLDEGEWEGKPGENRADSCYGVSIQACGLELSLSSVV